MAIWFMISHDADHFSLHNLRSSSFEQGRLDGGIYIRTPWKHTHTVSKEEVLWLFKSFLGVLLLF